MSTAAATRRYALLLVAHGARGKGARNRALARLAGRLAVMCAPREVAYSVLRGRPTPAAALSRMRARTVLVYPLLMSAGWLARVQLPRMLAAARNGAPKRILRRLPRLGLAAALPAVAAARANLALKRFGVAARSAGVIVLAHGSKKDRGARAAAQLFRYRLHALDCFASVRVAFLEEAPSLADVAKRMPGPLVVIGFFAGEGKHVSRDVPRLVAKLARDDLADAGHVGGWPELAAVIAGEVERAATPRRRVRRR